MSRSVRNNLIAIAVIAVVLAAPFLIPLNMYKGRIEAAASRALAREVHIKGPIHFAVYPNIGLSLSDVSIGNAPGGRDAEMMTVDKIVVGAKIGPLFSGRLQVTDLTLEGPKIHLEVAKDSTPNWAFGNSDNKASNAGALQRIGFHHIGIKDGDITYFDAGSGKSAELSDVSVSLNMADSARATLNLPLTILGTATYNGEPLNINARLDNFGALLDAQATGARISIGSKIINAEFTGQIGTERGLSGALKLGARSVRAFAQWLGHPLPPGNGFGLVALEGTFTARGGVYALTHTNLRFDSMNFNGDMSLDTKPDVMALTAHATVDRVDVNPYLAPGAHEDTVQAAKAKATQPDAPFSLSGLKAVNADMTLVMGGLVLPAVKLDQAVVKVTLNRGVLKADLSHVTAYGGEGEGNLTVDASGDTPKLHQTLAISGMKVQPFLKHLAGTDKISGTGMVRYDVSSRGNTTKEVIRGLHGNGEMRVSDGSIAGVDLAGVSELVRTALKGEIPADVAGGGAKTAFARLTASFDIDNGVVKSNDIQLTGPVQMSGRGAVDLADRTLEFHFAPKVAKNAAVPFFIKGPWYKPSYGPDARDLAKTLVEGLVRGDRSPLDVLTKPGLSLKTIFGTDKRAN